MCRYKKLLNYGQIAVQDSFLSIPKNTSHDGQQNSLAGCKITEVHVRYNYSFLIYYRPTFS